MKLLPTKIITNFLTDNEVDIIKGYDGYDPYNLWTRSFDMGSNTTGDKELSVWGLDNEQCTEARVIFENAIKKHVGDDIILNTWHILTSYFPYRAHTDGLWGEYGLDEKDYPNGYTFVVPLEDYDSCTIVYDQYQINDKSTATFMANNDPIDSIDNEFYEKYLTHESRENMRYFSVNTVFSWKKGNCLIMDRFQWHGSDHFHTKIPEKKAIIAWTTIKRSL
jgi:hypothetical protein